MGAWANIRSGPAKPEGCFGKSYLLHDRSLLTRSHLYPPMLSSSSPLFPPSLCLLMLEGKYKPSSHNCAAPLKPNACPPAEFRAHPPPLPLYLLPLLGVLHVIPAFRLIPPSAPASAPRHALIARFPNSGSGAPWLLHATCLGAGRQKKARTGDYPVRMEE